MSGFAKKLEIQSCANSSVNYVYWMYGLSGFEEILNNQNWVNSMGNCVNYMYKMPNLPKNW